MPVKHPHICQQAATLGTLWGNLGMQRSMKVSG